MTLVLLDYASVLIFALTGALAASRAQLDLIGFGFIACLTALGGWHIARCVFGQTCFLDRKSDRVGHLFGGRTGRFLCRPVYGKPLHMVDVA